MKVCTDSCLFGSMLPITNFINQPINTALDIGAGTGLLSLQYAQLNSNALITAIEIEANAYHQAKENIANTIFNNRIKVQHADLKTYQVNESFDLIFSNPPFYYDDLVSNNEQKNLAHHSSNFSYDMLFSKANTLLNQNGILAILIPTIKYDVIMKVALKYDWFINKNIVIHQNEKLNPFRNVVFLSKKSFDLQTSKIVIKEKEMYSKEFTNLLKPFYLNL
jgi:tRNA1Val (adenine37-N6)-methyltransferase